MIPIVERCARRVSGFKKPIDFSSLSREKLTVLDLDLLTSFRVKCFVEFVLVFGVCDGADCWINSDSGISFGASMLQMRSMGRRLI